MADYGTHDREKFLDFNFLLSLLVRGLFQEVRPIKITTDLKTATASQSNVGKALGITRQRVSQLVQEGVMKLDDNGNLLVVDSITNYVKSKWWSVDGKSDKKKEPSYMDEKARHERTKREMAQLKLAMMERNLYEARTVELVLTEMLANLRTQLLGLPSKLAPQLEGLAKNDIYDMMTMEIEEKLSELSEYTPELFTDEVDDSETD